MQSLVSQVARSMEHADQYQDGEGLPELYDSLEERFGQTEARAIWLAACKEYDIQHGHADEYAN